MLIRYGYTHEDLVTTLTTNAANQLLYRYDKSLSPNAYTWLSFRMQQNLYKLMEHHSRKKRIQPKDMIYPEAVNDKYNSNTDNTDFWDLVGSTQAEVYQHGIKEFESFMLQFWRVNASRYFSGNSYRTCILILDILDAPEKYPCNTASYVNIIVDTIGISRQAVHNVMDQMKAVNKKLFQRYLREGLLGLL
jgi:hypothetical protein